MNTGPKNTRVGLVFSLDISSPRSFSATGNTTYNGFPQMLKNMVAPTDVITAENGMYVGGPQYYTAFAIDYPEGNYGGSAASRQGLTPGLNVVSGGKTYDSSRALHMWVWNNDTNSWIADSFFRGFRLSGHCYDNYSGAENGYANEITLFIQDYNTIKATFPNCTFIITGSHRADRYTAALREILENLGMPKGYIESDYIPDPEWILVGRPNLGHGKAFGWSYENYSTDPSKVAHLVFHLPIFGGNNNFLSFDGTNDYINLPKNYQSGFTAATYIFVCKPTVLPSATYHQLYIQENSTWIALYNNSGITAFGIDLNNGSGWFDNNGGFTTGARTTATVSVNIYYHLVYSWDGNTVRIYLNGVLQSTTSTLQAANGRQNVTTLGTGTTSRNIGSRSNGTGNNWVGEINAVLFYDKALSESEILENLDGYKNRFKIN